MAKRGGTCCPTPLIHYVRDAWVACDQVEAMERSQARAALLAPCPEDKCLQGGGPSSENLWSSPVQAELKEGRVGIEINSPWRSLCWRKTSQRPPKSLPKTPWETEQALV
jgi:hypothetical protein